MGTYDVAATLSLEASSMAKELAQSARDYLTVCLPFLFQNTMLLLLLHYPKQLTSFLDVCTLQVLVGCYNDPPLIVT